MLYALSQAQEYKKWKIVFTKPVVVFYLRSRDVVSLEIFPCFNQKEFEAVTVVADINGDGLPDMVGYYCVSKTFYILSNIISRTSTRRLLGFQTLSFQMMRNYRNKYGIGKHNVGISDDSSTVTYCCDSFSVEHCHCPSRSFLEGCGMNCTSHA